MPGLTKNPKLVRYERAVLDRVRLALDARQMSLPDLKDQLERITGWEAGSGLYQWFKKNVLPVGAITAALPRALGVSSDWLFHAEGTMDSAPASPQVAWGQGVQYAGAKVLETVAALQHEAVATAPSVTLSGDAALAQQRLADAAAAANVPPARARRHRPG